MSNLILSIFSIIVQAIFCTYFLTVFSKLISNSEISKRKLLLLFICSLIIVSIGMFIKRIAYLNTLIVFILYTISVIYIMEMHIVKSILGTTLLLIFSFVTELITIYLGRLLFKISSIELLDSVAKTSSLLILQFVFGILIVYFINLILANKNKAKELIHNINSKQVLILILLILLFIVPQFIFITIVKYNYPIYTLVLNSLQIIGISILLINFLKITLERDKTKSDLVTSELHNKTMVGMVDGVRTLKHDYNNIIQALNGYVSTKQYDKLQEHINKVLKECNIVNNLSIINPEIFNEPAIYGIVGAKYFLATEADVTFDLNIVTNMSQICYPMPELSRILGILLDNALEATTKTVDKYIRLEMTFDSRKNADIIKVINTYDTNTSINLNDIYKKGVSSKKIKSGIGLWEVKKLISKVKNAQIYATIENDKFVQNIIIERI